MSQSDKNRSAMSGLISSAQNGESDDESDEEGSGEQATDNDSQSKRKRERFSVYADRNVFNRVRVWASYLDVTQADILERAIGQYCDRLAEHHNDGEDPEMPESEDEDPLL